MGECQAFVAQGGKKKILRGRAGAPFFQSLPLPMRQSYGLAYGGGLVTDGWMARDPWCYKLDSFSESEFDFF